MLNVID